MLIKYFVFYILLFVNLLLLESTLANQSSCINIFNNLNNNATRISKNTRTIETNYLKEMKVEWRPLNEIYSDKMTQSEYFKYIDYFSDIWIGKKFKGTEIIYDSGKIDKIDFYGTLLSYSLDFETPSSKANILIVIKDKDGNTREINLNSSKDVFVENSIVNDIEILTQRIKSDISFNQVYSPTSIDVFSKLKSAFVDVIKGVVSAENKWKKLGNELERSQFTIIDLKQNYIGKSVLGYTLFKAPTQAFNINHSLFHGKIASVEIKNDEIYDYIFLIVKIIDSNGETHEINLSRSLSVYISD